MRKEEEGKEGNEENSSMLRVTVVVFPLFEKPNLCVVKQPPALKQERLTVGWGQHRTSLKMSGFRASRPPVGFRNHSPVFIQ